MTTDTDRTLYVQIDFIDSKGAEHKRGESMKFGKDDKEGSELLRRGVLAAKPVRRAAGESSGRSRKGDKE